MPRESYASYRRLKRPGRYPPPSLSPSIVRSCPAALPGMNIDTFLHIHTSLRYAYLFITCAATGMPRPGVDFIIVRQEHTEGILSIMALRLRSCTSTQKKGQSVSRLRSLLAPLRDRSLFTVNRDDESAISHESENRPFHSGRTLCRGRFCEIFRSGLCPR